MYNIIVLSKGFCMSYISRIEKYFDMYNQYMWGKVAKMLYSGSANSIKPRADVKNVVNTVTPEKVNSEKLPVPTAEQVLASIQKNKK